MTNSIAIGVAYQDQAIVGGSIDNTPIGATTPAAGTFTSITSTASSGAVAQNATAGLYFLTTAITANTTTTTASKGSLVTTTNATGTGKLFISDGTKWQYPVVA